MATNGTNISEDTEMAECDGEKVVTMMDVLREQQDFEEDANAVLGASDDKNCTYAKGYVKRQAIYACLTCCPDAVKDPMKRAGVCLACSLACHENHELVELYTKRNFRCDCGNPKFSQPCQFTPNKVDLNYENKYNQNFIGIYCNCKRPYPDPESTEEEEMIQCIVCEDWLHTNHLEATVPNNEQYAEMICKACMEDIDFLHDYSDLVVNVEDKEIIIMDPDLDVTSIIKTKESPKKEKLSNGTTETCKDKNETVPDSIDSNLSENKKDETSTDVEMSESKPDESGDVNDASKEQINNTEQKTEASGDLSPDSAPNEPEEDKDSDNNEKTINDTIEPDTGKESGNNKESDNNEKTINDTIEPDTGKESGTNKESDNNEKTINDTIEPDTGKESGDKENADEATNVVDKDSDDKTTEVEKNTNDQTGEKEKTDEAGDENKIITESEDSESKDKETVVESSDNKMANTEDSEIIEDSKEEKVTTDVTSDEKPQESEIKEDSTIATSDKENEVPTNNHEHKRKLSEGDIEVSPKKQKLDTKPCVRPRGVKRVYKGATFWPHNLRQKLCTCAECLSMYKDLAVLFLIDPEDTVTAYEALGKENDDGAPSSQYEKGLQALSSLDRVQQINALTEYNKMRDKLLDFLKSFKDRKEIVKEEDIKAFFAEMKPKREPDGVYFCR